MRIPTHSRLSSRQIVTIKRTVVAFAAVAASVVAFGVPASATQPPSVTPVNCTPIAGSGVGCPNPPTQPGGLDHFLCYQVVSDQFTPLLVDLTDQFGVHNSVQPLPANAQPGNQLCNPVIKTPGTAAGGLTGPVYGVNQPDSHLYCFADAIAPPAVQVSVTNQFGTADLTVTNSTSLCLPSWKYDSTQEPPLPGGSVNPSAWTDPSTLNLNHFQCYQVQAGTAPNGGFAVPPTVQLQDQFGMYTVQVGAPTQLCAPVIKQVVGTNGQPLGPPSAINSEGVTGAHLPCFALSAGGPHSVLVGNQFSPGFPPPGGVAPAPVPVTVAAADQLCLPSIKTPIGNTPEVPSTLLLPLAGIVAGGGALALAYRRRRLSVMP